METIAFFFTGIALVLIAISIHEFAHAWTANYLGDSTARYRGRITLDPIAHLDPVGTMMILFSSISGIGIGWGRPVPVVLNNFRKNPPLGLALSSAAGPLCNLAQAIVAAVLLHAVRFTFPAIPSTIITVCQILIILAGIIGLTGGAILIYKWYQQRTALQSSLIGDFTWKVVDSVPTRRWWDDEENLKQLVRGGIGGALLFGFFANPAGFLISAVFINLALALFNLIPLGPLDGNGILKGLLHNSRARWTYDVVRFLDRIEPHSSLILFGLIFLEQMVHIPILSLYIYSGSRLIAKLLGVQEKTRKHTFTTRNKIRQTVLKTVVVIKI
ncbi:MAG: site-2 protease family protein [Anaerolineales bacterium]|nr:site-2 protease family protein [Anaerolineales bacterium]